MRLLPLRQDVPIRTRVVDYVEDSRGASAICPGCGLTTIIADGQDFELTPALLLRLRAHWLEHGDELIVRELENQGSGRTHHR